MMMFIRTTSRNGITLNVSLMTIWHTHTQHDPTPVQIAPNSNVCSEHIWLRVGKNAFEQADKRLNAFDRDAKWRRKECGRINLENSQAWPFLLFSFNSCTLHAKNKFVELPCRRCAATAAIGIETVVMWYWIVWSESPPNIIIGQRPIKRREFYPVRLTTFWYQKRAASINSKLQYQLVRQHILAMCTFCICMLAR